MNRQRVFTLSWQALLWVTFVFIGLIIGEFTPRRQVGGTWMTNSQMSTYLLALPTSQRDLEREISALETELSNLKTLYEQMQSRIEQAGELRESTDLEALEAQLAELNERNGHRAEGRIAEIEAWRQERLAEVETLADEAARLREEIAGFES